MKFPKPIFILKGVATFCVPVSAANSTVLGYNVNSKSPMWTGLVWDRYVMIDGSADDYQYLHVSYDEPGGNPADDIRYRVRPRLVSGDKVFVRGYGWSEIKSVTVAGMWDAKWRWRFAVEVGEEL